MVGKLYLIATPIGNLGDFSPRAVEALQLANFVAAEDTRVSMKLLNHFAIKKPMISYHEHNKVQAGPQILERVLSGETCALVTDAGTPAISDPGEDLVKLCIENDVAVESIPGCCAAIVALTLSGLPTAKFCFEGFLSANKKERRDRLAELSSEDRTIVFHEAPHKLKATLADLVDIFGGNRRIALCREMTKIHEDIQRTTLQEALTYYQQNEPRGEYVLVIEGKEKVEAPTLTLSDGVQLVLKKKAEGLKMKDAVRQVADDTGLNRNELYDASLKA